MTVTNEVADFLTGAGVFAPAARLVFEPLSGGVSSDIWVVSDGLQKVVVKTPLEQLRVADDWHAPVERSDSEADWLAVAGRLVPGVCPGVLAYDRERHLLALAYLDPVEHRLWKSDLLAGRVESCVAARVGDRIGAVHQRSSLYPELSGVFATDELFRALRIEPYLESLALRFPDLGVALSGIVAETMSQRRVLVHGDLSPKNILVGPDGPVLLDAETAWWGDPAFDLAFCINHLLLKTVVVPPMAESFMTAAHAFLAAYRRHVSWEHADVLEGRAARLLPALMLARVDGRSPVEYLSEPSRALVRTFAREWILDPADDLITLTQAWKAAIA